MKTVAGVRELKNKLSYSLREVKKGRSIMITEREKIVAAIVPAQEHVAGEKLKKTGEERSWNLEGGSRKGHPGRS